MTKNIKNTIPSVPRLDPKTAGAVLHPVDETIYSVTVVGRDDILMHRYDVEVVGSKGSAAKNSKEKKSDNLESYVYRCADGTIGIPGVNFKSCLAEAAKTMQDPRSPRKSLRDLLRSAISVDGNASFGVTTWDRIDTCRVRVQLAAISRQRPAMLAGWSLVFQINVLQPEYIDEKLLLDLIVRAGRCVGLGDHRPDFGKFAVVHFERVVLDAAAE